MNLTGFIFGTYNVTPSFQCSFHQQRKFLCCLDVSMSGVELKNDSYSNVCQIRMHFSFKVLICLKIRFPSVAWVNGKLSSWTVFSRCEEQFESSSVCTTMPLWNFRVFSVDLIIKISLKDTEGVCFEPQTDMTCYLPYTPVAVLCLHICA